MTAPSALSQLTGQTARRDTTALAREQSRQIAALYGDSLKSLLSDYIERDIAAEKILQYFRWRRADLYYRGIHHVYPEVKQGGNLDLTGSGFPRMNRDQPDDSPAYDYQFQLVKKYGELFVAVLGQRPFYNCQAVPDNPQSEDDKAAARQADLAALLLRSWWNVRILNAKLAHHLYKSGTIFPFVTWNADEKKYGTYSVPRIESKEVPISDPHYECLACQSQLPVSQAETSGRLCPNCGTFLGDESLHPAETASVPVQTGEDSYPNGRVELTFENCTTTTVPFYIQDLSETSRLVRDNEEPVSQLLRRYPEMREHILSLSGLSSGSSINGTGALVRSGAQSQTGTPRSQTSRGLVPVRYVWVTADDLQLIADDQKRDALLSAYPTGLCFTLVGDQVAEIEDKSIADHYSSCQPVVGDFLLVDGVCYGILGHQDLKNDLLGLMAEHLERGLPTHLMQAGLLDVEAINSRRHRPQEIMEVSTENGSLENVVKTLPASKFPDQAPGLVNIVEEEAKNSTHLLDQVFGATDTTRKTAEQARTELNQALMALGTTGEFMSDAWVQIHTKAVRLLAKHAPPNLSHQGQTLDLEALKRGKWHFESNVGVPRTYAERKDAAMQLLESQSPSGAALIERAGLLGPTNVRTLLQMLDLQADFDLPAEDHYEAVEEVIQQLLEDGRAGNGPTSGQPDPMTGMPGPPNPSVPYEAAVLDAQATVMQIQQYLVSPGGREQKKTNPGGYQNILAYMQQAKAAMAPPAPPPGAGPGPSPDKGGSDKGGGDVGPAGPASPSPGPAPGPAPGPPTGPTPGPPPETQQSAMLG